MRLRSGRIRCRLWRSPNSHAWKDSRFSPRKTRFRLPARLYGVGFINPQGSDERLLSFESHPPFPSFLAQCQFIFSGHQFPPPPPPRVGYPFGKLMVTANGSEQIDDAAILRSVEADGIMSTAEGSSMRPAVRASHPGAAAMKRGGRE